LPCNIDVSRAVAIDENEGNIIESDVGLKDYDIDIKEKNNTKTTAANDSSEENYSDSICNML
jgi:hypothetical protein